MDEVTGEKRRAFEMLANYPSMFKMEIMEQNDVEEIFESAIITVMAWSCGIERSMVRSTSQKNGKWTTVTVHTPVKSADILYIFYKDMDKDPRMKFTF